jgi:hypothetical protein
MPKSSRWLDTRFALGRVLGVAILCTLAAGAAVAQVTGLYYREVVKDGRVYVFNTMERYKAFEASGEMGTAITLVGRGASGETIVAENDTAVDLYLFKHNLPAYDRPAAKKTADPTAATLPHVTLGGLAYISYQNGDKNDQAYSKVLVKRAYVDTKAKILPYLSARATFDITQDSTGDWKSRFKYAYGAFSTDRIGFIASPVIEFGLDHMPWLDFEESINNFRMQDEMFMERNGIFNSADVGLLVGGYFGGEMPAEYKKDVASGYPGKYGSFQIGVYNGAGYHASEANTNKVLEGRITIRPVPDVIPGLQFTYFGINGKGNTVLEPDWTLNVGMISFQSTWAVITGQYIDGKGAQSGTAVDAQGNSLKRNGWSGFVEAKLTKQWSLIARYDNFNANTDASDQTQKRTIGGIAYKLGHNNVILVDYDQLKYDQAGKPTDKRGQVTLQVAF